MITSIKRNLQNIIFFLLGMFSTMSVVAVNIKTISISFYTIFLVLSTFILLLNYRSFCFSINDANKFYLCWIVISFISCLFGVLRFFEYGTEWQMASLSGIFKLLIYLLIWFLLVSCCDKKRGSFIRFGLYGVVFGAFANIIWAGVDAFCFYFLNFSLTNKVFASYIALNNIRYGQLSLISGSQIRSGGLNGDPANIGFFAIIVAIYSLKKRKYFLLPLAFIGVLSSVSIIGLAGIVIAYFLYLFGNEKTKTKLAVLFGTIFAAGILLMILNIVSKDLTQKVFNNVLNRIGEKKDSIGDSKRSTYYFKFPLAVLNQPLSLIIGTGFGTSSFSYVQNSFVNEPFFPYDPECTYIAYFFDCGLLGLVFFLMTYLKLLKMTKHNFDRRVDFCSYSIAVASLIAFLGYHYILYSPMMLALIFATVYKTKNKESANERYYFSRGIWNKALPFNNSYE